MESWYCYIIKSTDPNHPNISYNGSTNNIIRRLRQHNGELMGGAIRTRKGRPWEIYAIIKGLPNHINSLQLEWKIAHPSNKRKKESKYKGVNGRIVGLNEIMKLDQWTNQSVIPNNAMDLELWIQKDYISLLDINLPSYIQLHVVDKIDPQLL